MQIVVKKIHVVTIIYLWVMLFDSRGLLDSVEIGNYFNLTFSIIVKISILTLFLLTLDTYRFKKELDSPLFIFAFLILLSSLSTYLFTPEYTLRAASISFQIIADLSLILLIGKSNLKITQLKFLFYNLMAFIIINTFLIYISYLYPDAFSLFIVSKSYNYLRAFGIMGDQIPYLLGFFSFYALIKDNLVLFFFFTIGIILTSSINASFIALVLVLYYMLIIKKTSHSKYILLVIFILLSITVISYDAIYDLGIFQRLSSGLFSPQTNLMWRLLSLENGIDMYLKSPIWGYGYGAYSYIMTDSVVSSIGELPVDSATKILSTTSNQFLQILVESGILGLIAFIYLLSGFFRISFFREQLPKGDLKGLVLAINGWVLIFPLTALSAVWILPGSFIWVVMCILVGISYRIKIMMGKS